MNKFEINFSSDLNIGQMVLTKIMNFISGKVILDEENFCDIKLIFSELIFNSIIHGNKMDKEKSISLKIDVSDSGYIQASIKDEGEGFDYSRLFMAGGAQDDLFSEHGRGMTLVIALSDSINFNQSGNEINFSKKVDLTHVQHYSG